ncbi:unnamed protein product, partial [Onchocerca ochengi]|uniref:Uncharacterized protein n=1 Tax=Onchocerca ochengi TaxID=42157 RepID=A0A182EYA6_ONCOC
MPIQKQIRYTKKQ